MPFLPEAPIRQDRPSRIVSRRTGNAAARVRPRTAKIETLERQEITSRPDHRTRAEQLVEPHLAMKDVTADEPEAAFKVERRMDLPSKDGLGETGRVRVHSRDDLVGSLFTFLVPAPTGPEIVTKMLAEEARDMLPLRRKRRVQCRGYQYFDDRLLGPAVDFRIEPRAVHVIEARRHDDASRQMVALLRKHCELG